MDSRGVVAVYGSFLDVYTYMAFFFLDEHAPCLHTTLKQSLYIGCIKWLAFGNQRLIGRLNGKQQVLQPSVSLHRLTALAIHPALTWIP